jgi:type II secretory pathway component PulF
MFLKTRIFANLNQGEAARATIAEMKRRFGPHQKNMVHISGTSTTLSEAIRQLDEELAQTASTKKR